MFEEMATTRALEMETLAPETQAAEKTQETQMIRSLALSPRRTRPQWIAARRVPPARNTDRRLPYHI